MLKYVYILFYSENVNIIHKFIWYKSIYVRFNICILFIIYLSSKLIVKIY
jgi:hypothetical protein